MNLSSSPILSHHSISFFQPKCLAYFSKKDSKIIQAPKQVDMDIEELVDYLKDKDKKKNRQYLYSNKTVYTLPRDKKDDPKIPFNQTFWNVVYGLQISVWIPLCYFVYTNASLVHLSMAFLGFAMTVFTTRYAQNLMVNSILKMELVNNEQVMLYTWATPETGVLCNIEGAKLIPSKGFLKLDGDNKSGRQLNYNLQTEFIEAATGKTRKAIFLLSIEGTSVENYDLFKCILHGKKSEIPSFRYTSSAL